MRNRILTAVLCLFVLGVVNGQNSRPGVFIDCEMRCFFNYIKEQITFVDYMQDRELADIFILATWQRTGAGGRQVQLLFEGNNQFAGQLDTITYMIDPNATDAIERDQQIKEIKRGLLKYIVNTDLIDQLDYTIQTNSSEESNTSVKDPWNYWVFNIGGNGWLNGEQTYNRLDLTGRVSANRITDKNKFQFSARYNYEKNSFTLTDGEVVTNFLKSYNLYFEYVKSVSDHWSLGGISRSGSSTFGNTDVTTTIKAAVEYNIFPYSDAQTRRFSFFYSIGPEFYDYTEPTIYEKETEWIGRHGLTIQYEQTQKWGDIYISFGVQQFLSDLNLYNAYLNPGIEWQIFKGFSLNLGGFFSFVNDRINIAQSNIADEDILLQTKQLDTDFTYYSHFGVNYRFGSKFNNFVNPRF